MEYLGIFWDSRGNLLGNPQGIPREYVRKSSGNLLGNHQVIPRHSLGIPPRGCPGNQIISQGIPLESLGHPQRIFSGMPKESSCESLGKPEGNPREILGDPWGIF